MARDSWNDRKVAAEEDYFNKQNAAALQNLAQHDDDEVKISESLDKKTRSKSLADSSEKGLLRRMIEVITGPFS